MQGKNPEDASVQNPYIFTQPSHQMLFSAAAVLNIAGGGEKENKDFPRLKKGQC